MLVAVWSAHYGKKCFEGSSSSSNSSAACTTMCDVQFHLRIFDLHFYSCTPIITNTLARPLLLPAPEESPPPLRMTVCAWLSDNFNVWRILAGGGDSSGTAGATDARKKGSVRTAPQSYQRRPLVMRAVTAPGPQSQVISCRRRHENIGDVPYFHLPPRTWCCTSIFEYISSSFWPYLRNLSLHAECSTEMKNNVMYLFHRSSETWCCMRDCLNALSSHFDCKCTFPCAMWVCTQHGWRDDNLTSGPRSRLYNPWKGTICAEDRNALHFLSCQNCWNCNACCYDTLTPSWWSS